MRVCVCVCARQWLSVDLITSSYDHWLLSFLVLLLVRIDFPLSLLTDKGFSRVFLKFQRSTVY